MTISANQAASLNNAGVVEQAVSLGTEIKSIQDKAVYNPIIIKVLIDGDYHTTAKTVTIPYAFELVDVIVQARTASENGTATVRKNTTAITDAIVMAVDKVITRAGTIDDAQSTIATTDSINIITNGATDRGMVILVGYRA